VRDRPTWRPRRQLRAGLRTAAARRRRSAESPHWRSALRPKGAWFRWIVGLRPYQADIMTLLRLWPLRAIGVRWMTAGLPRQHQFAEADPSALARPRPRRAFPVSASVISACARVWYRAPEHWRDHRAEHGEPDRDTLPSPFLKRSFTRACASLNAIANSRSWRGRVRTIPEGATRARRGSERCLERHPRRLRRVPRSRRR
jgi:hypothetical protein